MARPKLLGIEYARLAAPVRDGWKALEKDGGPEEKRDAKAKLKSLATLEQRIKSNPLTAGDPVEHDRWPASLAKDYGPVPNLTRFELAARWRGYYALIGQPGGVKAWILYLLDHETYSKMSGYDKK
ncbi:MAG TPA: hypothetical protein VI796_00460 [Candidatus Thermoplasmatota archaeon]|nr:hypothetical protein [Candidatus Thermoplasmatota archaeon]